MKLSALLALVMLSACNTVVAGSECSTEAASECAGATAVAYCEKGTWNAYPCPSGCSFGSDAKCSWVGVKDGDLCPVAEVQVGHCLEDAKLTACLFDPDGPARWHSKSCPRCQAGKPVLEVLVCSGNLCTCD